ncbi:MAG: hypothetical protein DRP27_01755 [Thermotogae bacterium]|mgnify:CR=1 FL=1|nr:hypothetical protein [Thermotogota bacterium]RKX46309.1 MAG: hypothetical protein DRP27_01755 [Thermotogota bacterium]
MQIRLDEFLNLLVARLDSLEVALDDLKLRTNVLARLLKARAEFDKSDVKSAVKEEFEVMKSAGMISEYKEEEVVGYSEQLWNWLNGNVQELREALEKYREKLEKVAQQVKSKANIDIASPDLITQLDQLKKGRKGEPPKIL